MYDSARRAPVDGSVIPSRLRTARVAAGVTTVAAARHLGVRRAAIYEMEHGRRRCQPHELLTLAELYAVSPSWLLGRRSMGARDQRAERAAEIGRAHV